jgi:nitrite reductase (NADH) small subunit
MESASRLKTESEVVVWYKAAKTTDIPDDGGAAVIIEGKQIAIFNFKTRGE